MTATTYNRGLESDTRQLVDALVGDLMANQSRMASQSRAGTRDVGPDMTGGAGAQTGAQMSDQDAQRFFGGILQTLITDVIPKLAPTVLSLLQDRRRELNMPEQRDTQAVERDFQSILSALLPKLLDAVPTIAAAIAGKPAPRSAQEEGERFLPFLVPLITAVASAVPSIIGAFNQQRGADPTPPPITDPESQRFLGSLLATFVPTLLQAAPSILGSLFGGNREVRSSTW